MKNRYSTLLAFAVMSLITFSPYAQNFDWATDWGTSISTFDVTNSGESIVVLAFTGTLDVDPTNGVFNLTSFGSGRAIVKLAADKSLIWAKLIEAGSTNLTFNSIAMDNSGNMYATGFYRGTVDFDPSPGVFNVTTYSSIQNNIFVLKLSSTGSFQWAYTFGDLQSSFGQKVLVDNTGSPIFFGEFKGSVDFNAGIGSAILVAPGTSNRDIFSLKLSPTGSFIWAKSIGGSTFEEDFFEATIDGDNHIILSGQYGASTDFDPGIAVQNLVYNPDPTIANYFVEKLDSSGAFVWAKPFYSASWAGILQVHSNSLENIVVATRLEGTLDVDPDTSSFNLTSVGGNDLAIFELSPSGSFNWGKSIGGLGNDNLLTLEIANNDIIYLAGQFNGSCDFDPGPGVFQLTATNNTYDGFILKLSPQGNFLNALQIGGTGNTKNVRYIKSANSSIYCQGLYQGTVDFNPGPAVYNLTAGSNQSSYFLKLNQCFADTGYTTASACAFYTSPSGKYTWTTSGTYNDTLVNLTGCDSVVQIALTITPQPIITDTVYACKQFVSPTGNYTWTNSGVYYDTIPSASACDTILIFNLTIDTVDVGVTNTSPTLTANATNATYQWVDCNTGPISGTTGQSFTATANGQYAVIVTQNGCIDTSACFVVNNVGISDWQSNRFRVYPNPTKGMVIIESTKEVVNASITVTNLQGQLVGTAPSGNSPTVTLDFSAFPVGIYLVNIAHHDFHQIVKIVKKD